ncbi:hypothetical protein [Halobaculum sp. P14]|uniref:hypothetical protein n=1 Tax=Halobaculum sp. P14 TaxID=3421638 RepID=UPI003EB6964C
MSVEEDHTLRERIYYRIRRRLPPGGEDELNQVGVAVVLLVVALALWGIAAALGSAEFGPTILGFFALMYVLYVGYDYLNIS